MQPSRRTFSLRFLFVILAISSIGICYVTHDRTATLKLSAYESEKFEINDENLLFAVESIPPDELPRSLRSGNPDLKWLKQSLTITTNVNSDEVILSISSNRATTMQLITLLDQIAIYGQPATEVGSYSSIYQKRSLDERISDAVEIVDELFDAETP